MNTDIYNATVTGKILITPDLMVLRVNTDEPRTHFDAGQFTSLGLMASEKRSPNSTMPIDQIPSAELIIRAYSIASADHETQNFEFYISQVKSGQLTPRLFNLTQGRRMWVDYKILGIFKLNETPPDCNIVMIATGTGLAPYVSFLRSHLDRNKNIKLAVFHGAAYPWDLGYLSEMTFIEKYFSNFYYIPTLLKADDLWNGFRGYIETHLENKVLENFGIEISPEKTHFYLCGNPKMVESVSKFLIDRNYSIHTAEKPGSIHVESY